MTQQPAACQIQAGTKLLYKNIELDTASGLVCKDGRPVELQFPRAPRIRVDLTEEGAQIRIRLFARADTPDAAPYLQRLQQDVAELLLKLQAQGLDPLGFSKYARVHARTFADWEALDWRALYRGASLVVAVG